MSAGTRSGLANPQIYAWVSSESADHTQNLSLSELERLYETGTVT